MGDPDLFVVQVEMDVYTLLKRWCFLRVVDDFTGSEMTDLIAAAESFWKSRRNSAQEFLCTNEGVRFRNVFKQLRLPHIISDLPSAKIIEEDKILPSGLPFFLTMFSQVSRSY